MISARAQLRARARLRATRDITRGLVGRTPGELPFAKGVALVLTADVARRRVIAAREFDRLREAAGLPAAEERRARLEADEPEHRAPRRVLDEFDVARMVVKLEQRDALSEELRRILLAEY